MIPPRILVIDDQLATTAYLRDNFCATNGLVKIDVTTSDRRLREQCEEDNAEAGAVFTSGQLQRGEGVENSIEQVLKMVESGWPHETGWRWALVLLDLHFASSPPRHEDEKFGIKILEALVQAWPDRESRPGNSELPTIMLSSLSRSERERLANHAGALAYVEKPQQPAPARMDEASVLTRKRLNELLNEHGLIPDATGKLRGKSHSLLKVLRDARRVAQMGTGNAMILGPQGSGKSSLALYVHELSRLPKSPFVRFFSSPGAWQLEYANLFGCWKGAHNQAEESSVGAAERAHGGTLLIDEVHNLTSDNQQELLQFGRLDEKGHRWLRRLGNFPTAGGRTIAQANKSVRGELDSTKTRIAVDVLLLSATNEPLDDGEWRSANGFSEPLYTRLAVEYAGKPLRFPSLIERREDITELFESFLTQETERIGGRTREDGTKLVDAEVKARLTEYYWPGNVAEMQGVARAVARSSKDFAEVFPRHLPTFTGIPNRSAALPLASPSPAQATNNLDEVERVLRNAEVPRSLNELDGKLASLQKDYGELVKRVLEVTLEQTKIARGGKNFITPALRTLFPEEITAAYQAYRKLLSLSKLFTKNPPAPDSLLAFALQKAKDNAPKTKGSDDSKSRNDTE